MGTKQPKEKGSTFEREVAVLLSNWISGGKRDDLLWRSSISGGRATNRLKRGLATVNQAGDLCATCSWGERFTKVFYVECKFYRKLNLWSLFSPSEGGSIKTFWRRACEQATKHGLEPMLILKQNYESPLIITRTQASGWFLSQEPMKRVQPIAMFFGEIFDCSIYSLHSVLGGRFAGA